MKQKQSNNNINITRNTEIINTIANELFIINMIHYQKIQLQCLNLQQNKWLTKQHLSNP